MRAELRIMMNEEGVFEDKYRYRQLLKFVKPVKSKHVRIKVLIVKIYRLKYSLNL